MSMFELIDNNITDKNTRHSYIDVYNIEFEKFKYTKSNILEIGICSGGSIKLWNDYFTNATIYGLDINDAPTWLKDYSERIKLFECDAYNYDFVEEEFINKSIKFDIIIDDGPHTVDSMLYFVLYYRQLLNPGGILVIEDILCDEVIETIKRLYPDENIKVFDMIEGHCDDNRLLFIYGI